MIFDKDGRWQRMKSMTKHQNRVEVQIDLRFHTSEVVRSSLIWYQSWMTTSSSRWASIFLDVRDFAYFHWSHLSYMKMVLSYRCEQIFSIWVRLRHIFRNLTPHGFPSRSITFVPYLYYVINIHLYLFCFSRAPSIACSITIFSLLWNLIYRESRIYKISFFTNIADFPPIFRDFNSSYSSFSRSDHLRFYFSFITRWWSFSSFMMLHHSCQAMICSTCNSFWSTKLFTNRPDMMFILQSL